MGEFRYVVEVITSIDLDAPASDASHVVPQVVDELRDNYDDLVAVSVHLGAVYVKVVDSIDSTVASAELTPDMARSLIAMLTEAIEAAES